MPSKNTASVAFHSNRGPKKGASQTPSTDNSRGDSEGKPRASRLWGTKLAKGEGYSATGVWFVQLEKSATLPDEQDMRDWGCYKDDPEPMIENMKLPTNGRFVVDCPFCDGGELFITRAERKSSWCCDDCSDAGLAPQHPLPN